MCGYTLRALIDLYLIGNLIDYVKDIDLFEYTTRKGKKNRRTEEELEEPQQIFATTNKDYVECTQTPSVP